MFQIFGGKSIFSAYGNLRVPTGFLKKTVKQFEPAVWLAIANIEILGEELYYIARYQFELDLILG